MHFKSLKVKNFGPIEEYSINFLSKGLNILVGYSATGKTQIFGSLLSIIQGKKVLYFNDDSIDTSSLELITEHKNVIQKHEYLYQDKRFVCVFENVTSLKNITFSSNTSQLFSLKPTFYQGYFDINLQEIDITFIDSLIVSNPTILESWSFLKENYLSQLYSNSKKKVLITSRSIEQILKLLAVLTYHSRLDYISPLILDEAFDLFDEQLSNFIFFVLMRYSQNNQIILFSQLGYPEKLVRVPYVMEFPLFESKDKKLAPIGYNYNFPKQKLSLLELTKKTETELPMIVRYINQSILKEEEYRFVEFKEIKGINPTDSILSLVDQYVVAYLNENSKNRGRIFWGITDEDRKVVGVKLDYKQRDEIRKRISEKLGQIQPSLPPVYIE